jgi:hypothetical protein
MHVYPFQEKKATFPQPVMACISPAMLQDQLDGMHIPPYLSMRSQGEEPSQPLALPTPTNP